MSNPLTDCLVAAVAILIVGVGMGLLSAFMKARQDARTKRRDAQRFADAVPAAAKILAAEAGSRMNAADWTNVLHEFHRAGFGLEETQGLIRMFLRLFPSRGEG